VIEINLHPKFHLCLRHSQNSNKPLITLLEVSFKTVPEFQEAIALKAAM
jgi:hypothetical protein